MPFINGTLDAYQALEYLAKQPYVDKDRIGMLGFSWGASNALLAARKDLAERLPRGSGAASGHSRPTLFGGSHTYQFNPAATQESRQRVLEFFERELRK